MFLVEITDHQRKKIQIIYYREIIDRDSGSRSLEIHRSQNPAAIARRDPRKTAGDRDAGGARGADAREIETYPLFVK